MLAHHRVVVGCGHMTRRNPNYLGGGTTIGPRSDWNVFGGRKGCLGASELLWKAVQRYAGMRDWYDLDAQGFDRAVISYGVEV